jgi:Cys-tRNA(Pro) deacylase
MARKERHPVTRAVHVLREANVAFEPRLYDYVEKGGTRASAEALGLDEHSVIKTLIFEDDKGAPLIVLMHGDCQVSAKELARCVGVKRVVPCDPKVADRHSGYQVGGTSPFGTRRAMPVYIQRSIGDLDRIVINGGSRGFLVELAPSELIRVLEPTLVDAIA